MRKLSEAVCKDLLAPYTYGMTIEKIAKCTGVKELVLKIFLKNNKLKSRIF